MPQRSGVRLVTSAAVKEMRVGRRNLFARTGWRWLSQSSDDAESGAVLMLVALSLVGLLAMAALTIDGGLLFNEKRQAQNAADHAALAAAWSDCHGENARAAAVTSIARNGYNASHLTLSDDGTNFAARIEVAVALGFAALLGFDEVEVSGEATATCDDAGPPETWTAVLME